MSNLSGLPPAYAARAMQAATQDVVVRIVQLPETLENNPSPVKLTGTVMGQNTDGSVKLQTDQGIISMMLKDKGKLPEGLKLEIDIPAGRPPQQANIRSAPIETQVTTQSQQPSMVRAALHQSQTAPVTNPLQASAAAAELKIDRNAPIRPDELQDILASVKAELPQGTKPTSLNVGETIRLTSMPQIQGGISSTLANTEAELINTLLQFIADTPDDVLAQKLLSNLRQAPFWASDQGQSQAGLKLFAAFQQLNDKYGIPPQAVMPQSAADADAALPLPRQLDARVVALAPQGNTITGTAGNSAMTISSTNQMTPLSSGGSITSPASFMLGQIDLSQTSLPTPLIRFFAPNGVIQNFTIPFPATNLSHGQMVMLQNLSDLEILTPLTDITPQTLATWMKSGVWDSIQDLIHAASVVQPAAAQQIIQNIPSVQNMAQAGPLGLLLLSMFSTQNMDDWVPNQLVNLLREGGKQNILKSLQTDQAMFARLENATLPNDWRAQIFPFWHDGHVHKLPLYYKSWNDDEASDAEKRRKKMRFLFDLNLSRMGPIQVDGFFQGEQETPRLDMILRAEHQLSSPMQQKMKGVYTRAMERSNLNGELTFQFRADQWVDSDEMLIGV